MSEFRLPDLGGCWFCCKCDGDMSFSVEFDAWFHMDCLNKELKDGNPEAEIIAKEYGIPYKSKFLELEVEQQSQMTGIYFRVERNGKWLSLDLAEMTKGEIEKCLEEFDKPALIRTIVAILGVEQ